MRLQRPQEAAALFRQSTDQWGPVIGALEGTPLSTVDRDNWVEDTLALEDGEQPYWTAAILAYLGEHETALGLVEVSIERSYCSYPFMETDPLLEGLRSDASLATEYARVRDAGRACHEAFMAHIAG